MNDLVERVNQKFLKAILESQELSCMLTSAYLNFTHAVATMYDVERSERSEKRDD